MVLGVAPVLALTAAPFCLLAFQEIYERRAWIVAVALTLLFWVVVLADAVIRQGKGGANIGLGLLMLVWPVVVTLGAMASVRRRSDD